MGKNDEIRKLVETAKPSCEWLDEYTCAVWFGERKCTESDGLATVRSLYAEIHLDEDGKVVIGDNVYEQDNDGNADWYIGTDYDDDIDGMDAETADMIRKTALETAAKGSE